MGPHAFDKIWHWPNLDILTLLLILMEDPMKLLIFLSLSLSLLTPAIQAEPVTPATWLEYAYNDLRAAQILTTIENPLLGVALYHIEQAAEKGLKAYLIFSEQKFALIHDLPPLLTICQHKDSSFEQFAPDMKEISPYATKSRYPNARFVMPEKSKVVALLNKAQEFLAFVQARISDRFDAFATNL